MFQAMKKTVQRKDEMTKDKDNNNKSGLPDHEIESLARCFLPALREFYESEDRRRAFEEWERNERRSEAPEKSGAVK
jgi:hypothetical protein